jgi:antitoxin (DNA-binding transcriptional repressor) of toxin-antitoxin stability system
MQKVMLSEAREQLEALVEAALNGEMVLIERNGKSVQLVPMTPQPVQRQFGSGAEGILYISDDFDEPLEDFAKYME